MDLLFDVLSLLFSKFAQQKAVKALISTPAINLDLTNNDDWTPLVAAVFHERDEVAMSLLDSRADPNAITTSGKRAIDYAFQRNKSGRGCTSALLSALVSRSAASTFPS